MWFIVFDRWGNQIGVLSGVISAWHTDEINGEDSLSLELLSCDLIKGNRILWQDRFGLWHEHIVCGIELVHENGKLVHSVYCENSINETYLDYIEDLRAYDATAQYALTKALSVTRWSGASSVSGIASTNFYQISAREAISEVVKAWGGEIETVITVSGTGVSGRACNLVQRRGADNGKRFEYNKDIKTVRRKIYEDDVCSALYGYGKGLEVYDEDGNLTGGYSRKLTFGEINGGLDYVADEDAKQVWGLPDGQGGIKHAFGRVEFPECEDMQELKALTLAELQKRKVPQVTYTASVIDLADLGYDFEDVRTGDTVQLIDKEIGIRLQGRVLKVTRDLFEESATIITLGNLERGVGNVLMPIQSTLRQLESHSSAWDNAASLGSSYIDAVVKSLNHDLNQLGGYAYFEQGQGIVIYNRPRDASPGPTKALQLTGGAFRIANSKTAQGEWDWRTFGTGDGFTASELVLGVLRGGSSYWNLETGDLHIDPSATLGTRTVSQALATIDATITDVDVEYNHNTSGTVPPAENDPGWSTTAPAWEAGKYIWQRTATTTASGTTHSTPVMISGRDGIDGSDGNDGEDGVGISVVVIRYGKSASDGTQPSSWGSSVPPLNKGDWLWVKTDYYYSDTSTKTIYTKSYIGTDGQDGASVYVQSSSKSGGVTTVVLTDGTTTTTLTISDGEDGDDGTDGTNGLNGYVHVAWANSADGQTDFSTSVSTGKSYIGVYTDNTQADSQQPSAYSWSLIKGTDGQDGDDGVGITSIVPQYYKSTSDQTPTGGSWSYNEYAWESGKYLWTRSEITWDTTPASVTHTTATLATALNGANATAASAQADATQALSDAADAAKVATNYLGFDATNGLDVGYSGTNAKVRVKGNGVEVFDSAGNSALFAGIESNKSFVRVGKQSGSGNVVMSSDGYVDVRNGSTILAHFGYGQTKGSNGSTVNAPYFDFGYQSDSSRGSYSGTEGWGCGASGFVSHAEGESCYATGQKSHAEGTSCLASGSSSHAENYLCTASGGSSHAGGYDSTASGDKSFVHGYECEAAGDYQVVFGRDNVIDSTTGNSAKYLIVGKGSNSSNRADALYLTKAGNLWIAGTITQNSDRRLKEHHAYLGEDACDFIRKLKPALYTKDGERHVGLYAQDVQDADPWDTATVTAQHTDESLDFDPLTLDYTALIAPLIAYCQRLEERIANLEKLTQYGQ